MRGTIVLALSVDDMAAFDDPDRFVAHLPLGGGLDPTWLDLFSEAVRSVTDEASRSTSSTRAPSSSSARRTSSGSWSGSTAAGSRPWPGSPTSSSSALAGRWIELLEEELGLLPREEKPWIRDLTGQIVDFARRSDRRPDVVFAWAF